MGVARPALLEPQTQTVGDGTPAGAASNRERTLARLEAGMYRPRPGGAPALAPRVRDLLVKALKAYKRGDYGAAALRALDATRLDPRAAQAYHTLAISLEGLGELHKALGMYERALALDPQDPEPYLNLGLVAWRLRMLEGAEKFFRLYIDRQPDSHLGYNNLGGVLRDLGRFDDAIACLRGAIYQMPERAELWNTLGTVAMEQGSISEARVFYEEALRLAPGFARVYHNIAYVVSHTGPLTEAVAYYDKALSLMGESVDALESRHGRAACLLALGRLDEGWTEWEVRHDLRFRGSFIYALKAPRWEGQDLSGRRLLVMGEQGLGDEIMFTTGYPELIDRLGPEGRLLITCDSRLVPLLQRSFPKAEVGTYVNKRHNGKGVRIVPWITDANPVDYFAPNGSTLRFLRPTLSSFPTDRPLLAADPTRVAAWRARLEALGPGPYVGLCWRSMVTTGVRGKYFSPLDAWAPVVRSEGLRFINLQYGDCAAELDYFRDKHGATIHHFDDLDLKNDLDENAALCAALDLVVSAPTAAGALAGAVGTEVWLLAIGYVWPMLGSDRFPWFIRNRVMMPERYGDWSQLMETLASALNDYVSHAHQRKSAP